MGSKKKSTQKVVQLSRKQLRKEKRIQKKVKKNEYFQNKNKQNKILEIGRQNIISSNKSSGNEGMKSKNVKNLKLDERPAKVVDVLVEQQKERDKESKLKLKLQKEMSMQRNKQLKQANRDEDKVIKKLEKQLKMNKRKSKSIPKSFVDEGLDYLLEVCDTEKLQGVAKTEMNLQESEAEFDDDVAIVTGRKNVTAEENNLKEQKEILHSESESDDFTDSDDSISLSDDDAKQKSFKENTNYVGIVKKNKDANDSDDLSETDLDAFSDEGSSDEKSKIIKNKDTKNISVNKKLHKGVKNKVRFVDEIETDSVNVIETKSSDSESNLESDNDEEHANIALTNRKRKLSTSSDDERGNYQKKTVVRESADLWEDIYGRTRDQDGNVVQATTSKYIPPHLRNEVASGNSKRAEELSRLRKQLKGLLNRLTDANIGNISSQIHNLYMKNSRNDMNETLTALIFESLITPILSWRLAMELALLIVIIHANVGMEVGAHFLETIVKKFDEMHKTGQEVEDKSLDNVILTIAYLYNFKACSAKLIFNILEMLCDKFSEKDVDIIYLVLRNIGAKMRKDCPDQFKDLSLLLRKKANETGELRENNNSRVRFMLELLLAVKNNKAVQPCYDQSFEERLRGLTKTLVHKGKYITELKITLDELLKAEERGRWWIVGSAWAGNANLLSNVQKSTKEEVVSDEMRTLLKLARKQHMNTDTRRKIFCVLMSSEDYMDAFEKLLHLDLKAGQQQEIVHVLIHCLLQEDSWSNKYYGYLAIQLCKADRKYQLAIQYNVWDKIKDLSSLTETQIKCLAFFLKTLFLEQALPISVLKVVQFSDMDKSCVKLIRQTLLHILCHECEDTVTAVFARVSRPPKLRMFRESLRLFVHHFVLKHFHTSAKEEETVRLKERVELVDRILTSVDSNKLDF